MLDFIGGILVFGMGSVVCNVVLIIYILWMKMRVESAPA